MPVVSVIIPAYNAGRYIKRCLDAVAGTPLPDMEVIVIDDGSADGTGSIAEEYAGRDKRFAVIRQANQGVSAARNAGLRAAKGEYICFMDADDWISPGVFAEVVGIARAVQADVLFSGFIYEFPSGKRVARFFGLPPNRRINDMNRNFKYIKQIPQMAWNSLYKTDVIRKNDIRFSGAHRIAEDVLFNNQVFLHAGSAYYCPQAYYHYYQSDESALRETGIDKNTFHEQIRFYDAQKKWLGSALDRDDDRYPAFAFFRERYLLYTAFFNMLMEMHGNGKISAKLKTLNQIKKHPVLRQAISNYREFAAYEGYDRWLGLLWRFRPVVDLIVLMLYPAYALRRRIKYGP